MYQYVLFASLLAFGQSLPSSIDTGGLLSGAYGGDSSVGGWQGSLNLAEGGHEGAASSYGGLNLEGAGSSYGGLNLEGAGSSYGGLNLESHHQGGGGGGGGGAGGDFHHGVSIVGIGGGDQKGTVLDLTSHAGEGHKGFFGGSFVSSSKEGGGGGGGESHYGGSGALSAGYGVSEDFSSGGGGGGEYSDLLRASDHLEGGDGGGYKALSAWASGIGGGQEGLSAYHSDGAAGGSVWG